MYCESIYAEISTESPYSFTYLLTREGENYGIECFICGTELTSRIHRAQIADITNDEARAEELLLLLAKEGVRPVHLADVVEDFFSL